MQWIQRRGYVLGTSGLGLLLVGGYLGLVWSPPDASEHDLVRIMYVHVPVAWTMYLAFFLVMVGSAMYLWKRDLKWDRLAGSAAEIGLLLTALTLVAGSIWARPTWGVWWTWDPRLTTTAILFVIYAGYLMLRTLQTNPLARARQAAVVGIIGFLDIPVIQLSVEWWRSLHQGPTFTALNDPTIDDRMEVTLFVNLAAVTLLFLFLLGRRLRLASMEQERDELLWREAQRV
ncbi:MAG TPA: cytochrome c biogenesis protein CcsA [Chloroflexota bacterium]|nr:cytochrome c biogenesis protein CcsA [Chloroflexota bacterium]